jgi:hypothetical protein
VVWRVAVAIVLLECLIFWLDLLPREAAHWLHLSTRRLVMLGPPLALAWGGLFAFGIGTVGSLAFLSMLRMALTRSGLASAGWGAASFVSWMGLGLVAAAPAV